MKLLFLCVANSARSQMAEGLAKTILPSNFEILSAGSNPSGVVHPDAIKALGEIDIDAGNQKSKSIESLPEGFVQNADFVITLCAEEVCPVVVSKAKRLDWGMPDPASAPSGESLQTFRNIRDQIKSKIVEKFG